MEKKCKFRYLGVVEIANGDSVYSGRKIDLVWEDTGHIINLGKLHNLSKASTKMGIIINAALYYVEQL